MNRSHPISMFALTAVLSVAAGCAVDDSTAPSSSASSPLAGAAEPGWTYCSWEGGTCSFTGTRNVKYGANGVFVTRAFSSDALCSNTVFGDPLYGVNKHCYYENVETAAPPVAGNPGWVSCGTWEGSTCTFSGTRQVRYGTGPGAADKWSERTFSNSAFCSYTVFGDPAYGRAKQCWYSATPSQTPPTEPPALGNFGKTQIFQLGSPVVYAKQGEDALMRLRVYGTRFPYVLKPSIDIVRADGSSLADQHLDSGNHYWQLPGNTWDGYLEFAYRYNVNGAYLPPGTYTLRMALYQGAPPYFYDPALYECNGVGRVNQGCVIGTLVVEASSQPRSTYLTAPQSMHLMTGTPWTP